MSVNFLHKRTSTANKRPTAAQLDIGELAINYESGDPGIYFEDSNGVVRKIGPTTVGGTAPNASPAGSAGNSAGELWFDNSNGGSVLKVWNGSNWISTSISGLSSAASTTAVTIDSSNRVGIGTTTPTAQLELSGEGANASRFFITQANATTDGTDITGRRTRGTIALPEALQAGDSIFKIFSQSHDSSAYVAAGNLGWTASDSAGNSSFALKTRVGGTVADRLSIDSSGNTTLSGSLSISSGATIGTTSSPFQASATNDVVTKSYADATYAAGSFGIQAHASFDGSAAGSFDWSTDKVAEGNITSVTRSETGVYVINFDTDFSSANYTIVATAGAGNHTSSGRSVSIDSRATGSVTIRVERTDTGAQMDEAYIAVMVIGTLS